MPDWLVGTGASTGLQVGKVMGIVPMHTSLRMRMVGPSARERRGVRTGETRAGMVNIEVYVGVEARSRAHKQNTAVEKAGKKIILS